MNDLDREMLVELLTSVLSDGNLAELRKVLAWLDAPALQTLAREAKAAYGYKVVSNPVVVFAPTRTSYVNVIRAVRSAAGSSLREAKYMTDVGVVPMPDYGRAEELVATLHELGIADARTSTR